MKIFLVTKSVTASELSAVILNVSFISVTVPRHILCSRLMIYDKNLSTVIADKKL